MSYEVIATPRFKRDIKRLVKKYRSLKDEYAQLIADLENNPQQGSALGQDCYRIRVPIESKGKGKSGGARAITHIVVKGNIVFLLTIYDKSGREDISDKELNELLKQLSE